MSARPLLLALGACLGVAAQQSGQLTAGDVDDGLNFDHFLTFKERSYTALAKKEQQIPSPNLRDRVAVLVTDSQGSPFSCAVVEACCTSAGAAVELPTGTDGRLSVFPAFDGLQGQLRLRAKVYGATCSGQAAGQSCSVDQEFDTVGSNSSVVSIAVPAASSLPNKLDVTFAVDTTGSMGDELTYLQKELLAILNGVQSSSGGADIRAGLVLYKDHGDEYLVQTTPFGPVSAGSGAVAALTGASASGGGDYPEALAEAMEAAVALDWRQGNVARVLFLAADAPPHSEKFGRALAAAKQARTKGVKVYGLAASGVGDSAEYLMRLVSAVTGARYTWLTDDSGIGGAHAEPKVLCYQVTRLDALIRRILRSELTGQRVEATEGEVIRQVGRQEAGVCIVDFTTTTPTTLAPTTTTPTADAGATTSAATTSAAGNGSPLPGGEVSVPGSDDGAGSTDALSSSALSGEMSYSSAAPLGLSHAFALPCALLVGLWPLA